VNSYGKESIPDHQAERCAGQKCLLLAVTERVAERIVSADKTFYCYELGMMSYTPEITYLHQNVLISFATLDVTQS
jgi:hypothetical protein